MKTIKILGLILVVAIVLMVKPAFSDYTVELKNEADVVFRTYTVTTIQVTHMQKKAARDGVSVIKQFERAIKSIVLSAQIENKIHWQRNNETYIEEQSRQ